MCLSLSLAINSMFRCCIMHALEAVVKAKRVVSSQVKSVPLSDDLSYQWVLIYLTSHIKTYVGCRGLWLNVPANQAQAFGCFPTDLQSMWTWYAEIADLKQFKVLYSNPLPNFSDKKLIKFTGAWKGLTCLSLHELVHWPQADS